MNYLLCGADTYRSRQKLHEITNAYRAKSGSDADIAWVDGDKDGLARLVEAAGTSSLFSRKKMIVARRLLASAVAREKLAAWLEKNKGVGGVIVLLWEEELDPTDAGIADIRRAMDKIQEFSPLSVAALGRWIREEATRRGVRVSTAEVAVLSAHGGNLWAIANELEKIALGGARSSKLGCEGFAQDKGVFRLGDVFFTDRKAALPILAGLLESGGEEMRIFSYLAGHARTLLVLKAYAAAGERIPKDSGIHPFVVQKTARLVAGLDLGMLQKTLEKFFEEDVRIKTGGTKPQEALVRILLR